MKNSKFVEKMRGIYGRIIINQLGFNMDDETFMGLVLGCARLYSRNNRNPYNDPTIEKVTTDHMRMFDNKCKYEEWLATVNRAGMTGQYKMFDLNVSNHTYYVCFKKA